MTLSSKKVSRPITTVHPLEFAIYKQWLSKREDRDYQKHIRDQQQSKLVTQLIREYMVDIDVEKDANEIRHIKREAIEDYLNAIKV